MILVSTRQFDKKAKKFFQGHPQLGQRYKTVIARLVENPNHPSLKLHKLKGNLHGFSAISLDYQFRIVLLVELSKNQVTLVDLGSHDAVY